MTAVARLALLFRALKAPPPSARCPSSPTAPSQEEWSYEQFAAVLPRRPGNVVLLGPPGTGETHLAIALGIRACLAGHRVAFRTATEWVALLADAQRHGRLEQDLDRLQRVPLLIVDEVGYIPFDPQAVRLGLRPQALQPWRPHPSTDLSAERRSGPVFNRRHRPTIRPALTAGTGDGWCPIAHARAARS